MRGELIEEVTRRGWQYSSDIEFPTLANMPAFKGHTPGSLARLYGDLALQVIAKQKAMGVMVTCREVTATQVHKWWNAYAHAMTLSGKPVKRNGKTEKKRRWEEELISAYNGVLIDLGLDGAS